MLQVLQNLLRQLPLPRAMGMPRPQILLPLVGLMPRHMFLLLRLGLPRRTILLQSNKKMYLDMPVLIVVGVLVQLVLLRGE